MPSSHSGATSSSPPSALAPSSACRLDASPGTARRSRLNDVTHAPTCAAPRRSSFLPAHDSGSCSSARVRVV